MIKVLTPHLKFILSFILVASGFLLAYNAYAQETVSTTTEATPERPANPRPEERQAIIEVREEAAANRAEQIEERQASTTDRQEAREERVEIRQTVRADRQAALSEVRQQRVLNLSANISNRMDAAIVRLFSVIDRLESRIEKLKQAGQDTAAAEAKLREAAEYVASARALLSNIDTLVTSATTSEQPLSNWQEVRSTYQEAGRLIRASHQSLREAIALLKGSLPRPETASTTEPATE